MNTRTVSLIDRLARLNAAEAWSSDLNPSQAAALGYLASANRFSRAPSNVADYLGSTRGTVSQTLKALARKGLAEEVASDEDRRKIRYDVTQSGLTILSGMRVLDRALAALPATDGARLDQALSGLLHACLKQNGQRSFGLCRTCVHHQTTRDAGFCRLLNVALSPEERKMICHEHAL